MSELAKTTYFVDDNIIPKFHASDNVVRYALSQIRIFLSGIVLQNSLSSLIVSSLESASTKQKLTSLGVVSSADFIDLLRRFSLFLKDHTIVIFSILWVLKLHYNEELQIDYSIDHSI